MRKMSVRPSVCLSNAWIVTYNVRKILSPSSSLPLLAKTITLPAVQSLCDSWASCTSYCCVHRIQWHPEAACATNTQQIWRQEFLGSWSSTVERSSTRTAVAGTFLRFLQTIFENTSLWWLKRLVSLSTYRRYTNKCIYLSIYLYNFSTSDAPKDCRCVAAAALAPATLHTRTSVCVVVTVVAAFAVSYFAFLTSSGVDLCTVTLIASSCTSQHFTINYKLHCVPKKWRQNSNHYNYGISYQN